MELLRLRGTARRIGTGDGPLAGSCELGVRQKKQRHAVDGTFELVDADGNKTVIEIAGTAVLVDDERRATYSKISGEPGVAEINLRPDPNIEVTLRTGWILDGSAIDLVGKKQIAADGKIEWLAAGSQQAVDAWEKRKAGEVERKKVTPQNTPLPWNVIIPVALVVITIIFAEASVTLGTSTFTFIAPSIAITTAAVAVGLLWDQIRLPKFDEREKQPTRLLAAGAVVVGIAVNLPPEGPLGTLIQGAIILAVGVFGMVRERRQVRLARMLVQPPSEPQDGKPGVFVGRVGDESPEQFFSQLIAIGAIHTLRTKAQKAASKADRKTGSNKALLPGTKTGSNKAIDTERRGFDSTFQLVLATGNVDVDPKDATWSSEHRNKRETWSVFLPVDAAVAIAGTPTKTGNKLALKASAPDSLVIYGVPADKDPQDLLRRKLMLHKLTYGTLFMVIALAAALAIHGFSVGA